MIYRSFLIKTIFIEVRNAKYPYAVFFIYIIFTLECITTIYMN